MHLLSRRATVGVVVASRLLLAVSQVRSWSLGEQGRRSYLDESALSGRSSISLSFTDVKEPWCCCSARVYAIWQVVNTYRE
jgi:hypothetical protein